MEITKWEKARKNKGLTQLQVARKANISLNGYIKIEKGANNPKPENEAKLKKILEVD